MSLSMQERKVVIIGVLALLVAIVTYGVLSSTGTFQDDALNLSGAIVGFVVVVMLLNRVYGGGFLPPQEIEESLLSTKADDTSSATEVIEGADEITVCMTTEIQRAHTYIYTIGGQSRNETYLEAIKLRVQRGDIRYIRVITGDHIRHQLCEHLQELGESVELGYIEEEKYGGIMVTHDTTFIALPSPEVSILNRALKIRSETTSADYRAYVAELLGSSYKEIDTKFIKKLCKKCRELQSTQ